MQKTIARPLRYGEFGYSWGGCGGLPGVLPEDPDIPCRAVFQHINIDEFCFMLSGSSCATIGGCCIRPCHWWGHWCCCHCAYSAPGDLPCSMARGSPLVCYNHRPAGLQDRQLLKHPSPPLLQPGQICSSAEHSAYKSPTQQNALTSTQATLFTTHSATGRPATVLSCSFMHVATVGW